MASKKAGEFFYVAVGPDGDMGYSLESSKDAQEVLQSDAGMRAVVVLEGLRSWLSANVQVPVKNFSDAKQQS
jgi:hypothetical protein